MVWISGSSLVEEYEVAHGRLTATIHAFWTMVSSRERAWQRRNAHLYKRIFPLKGQDDSQAAERFLSDCRRFPPGSYEERSLVWKNAEWRQLEPSERAQIMGIPVAALAAVPGGPDQRLAKQNSLIGNGFHIPSILVLLMMLHQLLEAKIAKPLPGPDFEFRNRLNHTVWEPGRLESMPVLGPEDVINEMQLMLLPFGQIHQLT